MIKRLKNVLKVGSRMDLFLEGTTSVMSLIKLVRNVAKMKALCVTIIVIQFLIKNLARNLPSVVTIAVKVILYVASIAVLKK